METTALYLFWTSPAEREGQNKLTERMIVR